MNTIKLIFSAAILSLLVSSCAKETHTCVCTDSAGRPMQDQRFKIETTTQKKAVSKCNDHETELNLSGSSYNCYIE